MTEWIAASASLVVATTAVLLTYRTNRRLSQRQDQLARINLQLEQFYGPLLTLSSVSNAAWDVLIRTYRRERVAFLEGGTVTEEDRDVWVQWMQGVFMPANRRIYEVLVTKAHLLAAGDDMPQSLLDFCVHVAGYEIVMKQWERGDYSRLISLIDYPTQPFLEYVRSSFAALVLRVRSG
jgi:hypothetical protein